MRPSFLSSRLPLSLSALVSLAVLAGCASSVNLEEPRVPVEDRKPGTSAAAGAASPAPQSGVSTVDLGARASAPATALPRTVYFDFDSFVVRDDARPVIEAHAKRMSTTASLQMVVEGHTDERGSREYNLALGQRRAEAVVKSLTLLGARANQIEAVSFGMERPAVTGSDESAWAKNRRAELKDR